MNRNLDGEQCMECRKVRYYQDGWSAWMPSKMLPKETIAGIPSYRIGICGDQKCIDARERFVQSTLR